MNNKFLEFGLLTLVLTIVSFSAIGQNNLINVFGGYSFQPYQFRNGDGYNIGAGFERELKDSRFSVGFKIMLSNTYANSAFNYYSDDIDITVGGANYIDFPNGVESDVWYPLHKETYLDLKERGYLRHYKPKESYFHDLAFDIDFAYDVVLKSKITWELGMGCGLVLSNSAETLGSYEDNYPFAPSTGPDAIRVLYKPERITKHLWFDLNIISKVNYKLSENYNVFILKRMHVTPKLLFYATFQSSLYTFDVGISIKLP